MSDDERAAVVVASNRGPVSFALTDDGSLTCRRGGGGLITGIGAAAGDAHTLWVCAALSEADRRAALEAPGQRLDRAGHDTAGGAVRMLDIDPATFHRAYNGIANSTLWYVNHTLYDTPHQPVFDAPFHRQWLAYVDYNAAFADAIADEAADGAKVLVQDYHLTLAPRMLREKRPDLRIGHFMHTPWAEPAYFSMLPDDVARETLHGILGADSAGFLSPRWADAFARCCAAVLGADVGPEGISVDGRTTRIRLHPLGVDAASLTARAHAADVENRLAALRERVEGLQVVLRIDRTELSKNIVRGLLAYRELLRTHPEHRGAVTHLVLAYPSRHDLPDYRAYTADVLRIAQAIEDEFGTAEWTPVVLEVNDDYARSLAAYRLADVLVVNPLRDGMNLVAKEGPVLCEREDGVALVLSREAGAFDELGEDAFCVNPYDVSATAEAMHAALTMPRAERAARSARLAAKATAMPPQRWLVDQLDALDS